jgi:RNA polymerase sigma-70 factor (ECF subfamily)
MRPTEINGSPGALVLDGSERVIGVVVLDIGRGQIQGISSIVNPDKLAHLGPTTNLGSLL